ncbi:FIG081498: hypothetical protein [hydrothermal vent metagenome]|uniref:TIGR04219 family outer membrane beta-barrel protein n=1 Tax=hydrothermal vent metagenome TaxID=652676 RepID=A0A1W1CRG4_9ZZZZ
MRKSLTTLACATLFAVTANADFGRIEMGGGIWNQTPSGTLSYSETANFSTFGTSTGTGRYTSDEKEKSNGYVWMLIKHPIPILPNIRLEYTGMEDSGVVSGSFADFNTTGTTGSLSLTQYDIIPYYNILDNTAWTTLDIGLDLKVMETRYIVDAVTDNVTGLTYNYSDTVAVVIPLVYARVRVEIPLTNIGIEADGKYISYNENTIYDARVKVDYTLDFIPVIQPGLEIGYRVQKFDTTSEDKKTEFKMDFSGVYAGLMIRF